jgi:hypothetical protein
MNKLLQGTTYIGILIFFCFALNACSKLGGPASIKDTPDPANPTPVPTIQLISPSKGYAGDTIVISGTNYSTTIADNLVKLNGVDATVISATATSLSVKVPQNGSTGTISLKVKNSETIVGPTFTCLPPITITGISPTSDMVGATVTITGTNFSAVRTENIVSFNGTICTVSAATTTTLTVTVPQKATSGIVKVIVNNHTVTGPVFTVIPTPTSGDPTITSISPTTGYPKDTLTITGTNFSTTYTDDVVKLNNIDATVIGATPTQLQVKVPANATNGAITIKVKNSNVTTGPNYSVLKEAVVTSIVPSSAKSGDLVTINGANFGIMIKYTGVRFQSGAYAKLISVEDNKIVFTVPPNASTGVLNFDISLDGVSDHFHFSQSVAIFTFIP